MRYRPLDSNGDYTIGQPFLVNSSQAVAQAILTRLKLLEGEWFVDTTDGTPYFSEVLVKRSDNQSSSTVSPDAAIQQRILGTTGVTSISSYSSTYSADSRTFTVNATVDTQYGTTTVSTSVST